MENFPWVIVVVGGPILLGLGIAYGVYWASRRNKLGAERAALRDRQTKELYREDKAN